MKPPEHLPTVSLAAEVTSPDLTSVQGGGWLYGAVAQLYKKVNQHLLYFFPRSGTKTIQERVPRQAIKIESGHPGEWPPSGDVGSTLGYVHSAEERQSSMRYVGFLSKSSEEAADKITDHSITENSIVLVVMTRVPKPVDIEMVPEVSRPFVSMDKDGKAVVTGVREWRWESVGLVPGSSQDFNAITSPPTMVGSVAGLSVASAPWDARIALRQLYNWGNENQVKLSRAHLAQFYGRDGELILAGQVAAPDATGSLIANINALWPALCDVWTKLEASSLLPAGRELTWTAACAQALACASQVEGGLTRIIADGKSQSGKAGSASGTDESIAMATADVSDPITATATSHEPAGPATPPTVGSEETDRRSVMIAHQEFLKRLGASGARYRRVANEPAIDSGGLPAAGPTSRS